METDLIGNMFYKVVHVFYTLFVPSNNKYGNKDNLKEIKKYQYDIQGKWKSTITGRLRGTTRTRQKQKQTQHYVRTKNKLTTWTPPKNRRGRLVCSGRISSLCFLQDTHHVAHVKSIVWGRDIKWTSLLSFWRRFCHTCQPNHDDVHGIMFNYNITRFL